MKKGPDSSISQALRDMLEFGTPRNEEVAEAHFNLLREVQANSQRTSYAVRGGKMLCLPHSAFRRDMTAGVVGQGRELVGTTRMAGTSDLLSWSACVEAGATILPDLKGKGNVVIPTVTSLPDPVWLPEVGQAVANSGDIATGRVFLSPKRICSEVVISNELLVTGGDIDQILTSDIGRALSSYLDRAALMSDPSGFAPAGIANTAGTLTMPVAGPTWPEVVNCQVAVASANVPLTNFAMVMSPAVAGSMMKVEAFVGGGNSIWDKMIRPLQSMQIDNTMYFGTFNLMVIGLWGGVDLILNPYSRANSGQTIITASIYTDVGVRLPQAFGRSITPVPVL